MCRDMGRAEGAGTLHNSGHRLAAHCYEWNFVSFSTEVGGKAGN